MVVAAIVTTPMRAHAQAADYSFLETASLLQESAELLPPVDPLADPLADPAAVPEAPLIPDADNLDSLLDAADQDIGQLGQVSVAGEFTTPEYTPAALTETPRSVVP